ncbi:hypothetical protein [Tautonia sociabilis]|uniref:DUF4013 domain-containing protein n=1 Tax=Tautonia sociabilis TaxID=2080755 RepID=A0A432MIM4_9BACT|nr:hypothetical protein [Tautonia sociabilis]RUL87055.1 hypothetical protein TsocGM_14025 [Tautonia sociabilis]
MATATPDPLLTDLAPSSSLVSAEPPPPALRRIARGLATSGRAMASAAEWVFGALALVVGLAVLAAIPVAQLLCLGYLLEAGGRVARSGRLRDGLVGVRLSARLGGMAIGILLWTLPIQLFASMARSAAVIDPGGPIAARWRVASFVVLALTAAHLTIALARGGRLRHFLWPFGAIGWLRRNRDLGRVYRRCRDDCLAFASRLRLPYYARLGLLGFLGTLAWLVLPATLLAAGRSAPLLGLIGALLLGGVAMVLPFLQMHFAVEGRLRAFRELRPVRDRFRRAPWAFALALTLTATLAVPLYLLKIEMIPREAVWLPSLVFLTFTFPARLAAGWAYHRSSRRDRPRHWVFRASGRLWMLPIAALYVLFVFLSQFAAWRGAWSLYEQHAFLLPVPFIGL